MEEAIANGDLESVRFLLDAGHNPNPPVTTPYLFLTEDHAMISLLLSYGADPKIPDENGFLLSDYTDDPAIIELLTTEKNIILAKPSKFTKYRGTLRSTSARAKTRRRARPQAQAQG
uniref:Ankyrin repeat protein n=1 Tax=viral metagenome TaxID=1070528 RepID=A0A6C0DSS9_9ZZZZ